MEALCIPETKSTPYVRFDFSSGTLDIKGKSIPEDAIEFYRPVTEAITRYSEQPQPISTLNFELFYFNTSSSKCILKLLSAFAILNKRLTKVKINWYYDPSDDDQLETANDIESSSGLEFKYIALDSDDD